MGLSDNDLLRLSGARFRAGGYDKAVLAVGSTEYHGDHLPYGTDSIVAESLASAVAERVKGMVRLPTIPLGVSGHYASFPVAVTLSNETLIRVLREVFDSLRRHGLLRLLVINGHDGNIAPLEAASRGYRVDHPEMRIAVLEAWWVTAGRLLPEGTFRVWGGLGHAGEGETSMMRFVAPALVEMEHARGVVPSLPEHVDVKWLFEELTSFGVTGDPTQATPEKGRLMHEALVAELVRFVGEMDAKGWDIRKVSGLASP